MADIVLEAIRAAVVSIIFVYLCVIGRKHQIQQQKGWFYIVFGFALILFGMIIDITDNFPHLNKYIIVGDTEYEAFLEKVVGYLFGFIFLAIGFWKWMPTVILLDKTKRELKMSYDMLELKVSERTAELKAANAELRQEMQERRKAEEALRESEAMLKESQRVALIGHYNFDPVTGYWTSSEMLDEIFGIDANYVKNVEGWLSIVHPDLRAEMLEYLQDFVLKEKKPFNKEYQIVRVSDKAERWVHGLGSLVFDHDGHPVRMFGVVQDITYHKKMEDEMAKAQKLESLGILAGGIAHDFNNLLTGILGNISLAKMLTGPDEKIYERLQEAEKASERAKYLTSQLLTFAKGGSPVKKTSSIEQVVMDSASFSLRGSNVRCEFSIPDNIWQVEVDEGQMSQVVNNLIINADQAMPDGGVVSIRLENRIVTSHDNLPLKEGNYVKICIQDRGIGISRENMQKIFDPYFTTKQRGTGLGLAMVYSIIKKHDGHIEVESSAGTGTSFHIYLPAAEKSPDSDRTAAKERITAKGHGKILIMDDEDMVREVAKQVLIHMGYDVEESRDGREALEIYRKAKEEGKPFDVVIMDLTIPGGMGGKELIKHLREIDKDVKTIVSSGYSNDPVMSMYQKFGFNGVVAKPYKVDELGRAVQKVIGSISPI
ncbi:MAG: ATP-binding protein [Nitrospirota bacterium]